MLAPRPASIVRQKDMSAAWRHVDFVMVAVVAMTSMFGVAMVYSATRTGTDPWLEILGDVPNYKQLEHFPWERMQVIREDVGAPVTSSAG